MDKPGVKRSKTEKDVETACSPKTCSRGILYVTGTPIGNLQDISARALKTLQEVSLIAAEDTRQTRKLLSRYQIKTKLMSCHQHNSRERAPLIIERLAAGEDVALVSDAGMPLLSDPGEEVVAMAIREGYAVTVIPGPSAGITALAVSGLPAGRFVFEGFLPYQKKQRMERLAELAMEKRTMILYEAPHKLRQTLKELGAALGMERPVVLARELTKIHEEFIRTTLAGAYEILEQKEPRGEYTLVVAGIHREHPAGSSAGSEQADRSAASVSCVSVPEMVAAYEAGGMDLKSAMKAVARTTGKSRRDIYALYQKAKNAPDPAEE